jgi:hypothetical protein
MYELAISNYYEAMVCIQQAIHMSKEIDPTHLMTANNRAASISMLDKAKAAIQPLHLPVTKLTLDELHERLTRHKQNMEFSACGQMLIALSETMRRELQSVKVFSLDAGSASFYSATSALFGNEVDKTFPSVAYEIEQGGKCYACDLSTAAAFHWIRTLEAGVRAMARCLGIPDPTTGRERNWSVLQKALKDAIDLRWPKSSGRISGDAQLFDKLYGSISGMQNPYRNETMHLSAKYTSPEALHIFELVKGLMQQIAARMDENGDPKA